MDIEEAVTAIKTWIGPMRKVHKDNDFANEFIDAAWELALAALREKAERERTGGWISVKTPPKKNGSYNVMIKLDDLNVISTSFYYSRQKKWSKDMNIPHWQPLPKPPKGAQE